MRQMHIQCILRTLRDQYVTFCTDFYMHYTLALRGLWGETESIHATDIDQKETRCISKIVKFIIYPQHHT